MRRTRRGLECFAIVASLGLTGAAGAGENDAPAALYTCGEASDDAAAEAAEILAGLPGLDETSPRPVHVSELLGGSAMTVIGGTATWTCSGEPTDAARYGELLNRLEGGLYELDDITPRVDAIRAAQPCLVEPVTPAALARADYLVGIAAFSESDHEAARSAFRQVYAVDPTYAWDDNYPPSGEVLFAEAKLDRLSESPVRVRVLIPSGGFAWLNGRTLATPLEGLDVTPGQHLVQVRRADESAARSVVVDVSGDTSVTVVEANALTAAGPDAPGFSERFAAFLAARQETGAEPAVTHVVSLAEPRKVWVWDGSSLELQLDEGRIVELDPAVMQARRVKTGGGVLLGTGAAVVAVGVILAVHGHQRGSELDLGTWPARDANMDEYADAWTENRAGLGLAAGGAVLMAGGVALLVRGSAMEKKARTPSVGLNAGPGYAFIHLSGTF